MNDIKLIMYSADMSSELPLPFADQGVRAGFPSPAQDYMTDSIDLNRELIRHPATTFYARASGDSMKDCGIDDGDLLVIDKALEPHDGDIVVAFIDGEFTLKRFALTIMRNVSGSFRLTRNTLRLRLQRRTTS